MNSTDAFQAVVLAAGFGRRLMPLTASRPKALVPFFTVPLIDFALLRLARLTPRPRKVFVNLHHLPDPIVDHVGDGRRFGLRIAYSDEREEILGTGGALRRLAPELGQDPFFVMNADVFFDVPLPTLSATLAAGSEVGGVVGLARDPARPDLHLVSLDCDSEQTVDPQIARIQGIGRLSPGGWIFAGAHLLTSRIFDHLPPSGFACVVRDGYRPMMAAGVPVTGVGFPRAVWHDMGTPQSYLAAHLRLFPHLADIVRHLPDWTLRERPSGVFRHANARVEPGAVLRPPLVLDAGAHVARGARVGPFVVIGRNAHIGEEVQLSHSVVWPHTEVRNPKGATISQRIFAGLDEVRNDELG